MEEVIIMLDKIKDELKIIPLKYIVLFHGGETTLLVDKSFSDSDYFRIAKDDYYAIALTLKDHNSLDNLYKVGTLVKVVSAKKLENSYQITLLGLKRVEVTHITRKEDSLYGKYEISEDIEDLDAINHKQMLEYIKKLAHDIGKNLRGSETYIEYIDQMSDLREIMVALIPYINISVQQKQSLMEIRSLRKRSLTFLDILIEYKESIQFQVELTTKFSEEMTKAYREKMLREQLRAIQDELDRTTEDGKKNKKNYKESIELLKMPKEVKEVALEELEKYEREGVNSSEMNIIRSYLDLLIALPWGPSEANEISIEEAREVLNRSHYGLDQVKDHIIQHISVMKLKKNKQGSIVLLVGPPGTGKTSLGKSIAEALHREYVRISLGGIRDEAEIRGHRKTYIGAMPGRIIQGMKRVKSKNPVFVLDEVDKVMASINGDPSSALLEVLDPEQNSTFTDHYLDVPYDLSEVFFIGTANSVRDIPAALTDRMEVIEINSYTSQEKFHIAKNHLIAEVMEEHGLSPLDLQFTDETVKMIIEKYTREAGVRSLKRQLAKITRVMTEKIVTNKVELPYTVKETDLIDILGREIAKHERVGEKNCPGVATGLAWTPVGGDILFIEAAFMPGDGKLLLTGQLGDVMKESAKISQSLIRSRLSLHINHIDFEKQDLHIHVPAGATPKDGPSAGIAIFATIASLVTGHSIDSKLAMTGEISLRGKVLPVGGIKEKVIAAERAGIVHVMLPSENVYDLKDVPIEVKTKLKFIFVDTIEDVLRETIGIELPKSDFVDITLEKQSKMTFGANNT